MKTVNADLAARMASGAATTCLCWRFERRDGAVFGATDHDRTLHLDGLAYAPEAALGNATFEATNGLAPGRATVEGALSASFLTETDLSRGLWDGARVAVWRVDWMQPDLRAWVWSGRLGEVARQGEAFEAELLSDKAALERRIGRVYGRTCDAELGDARCGVNVAGNWTVSGAVIAVLAPDAVQVSGLEGFAAGVFTHGQLTLGTGERARITAQEGGVLRLAREVSAAAGMTASAAAGCDKNFATCRTQFGNGDNFRGFPHLPGMDAVLSGPSADGRNDGGRR